VKANVTYTSTGDSPNTEDKKHQDYWIWPLPPPGAVTFVCEWPKLEIPESQATIEGEAIREAAGRAERVWPAHSD
jgi:hypothetical protein